MLQDPTSTTFGRNRWSYTASIQPLRLQHKRYGSAQRFFPQRVNPPRLYEFFMHFLEQFYAPSCPMRVVDENSCRMGFGPAKGLRAG